MATWKKLIPVMVLVAVLVLCVAFLPKETRADEAEIIDSGTCGENLTWTLDDEGTLTISGEGEMNEYGYGASPAPNKPAPWSKYYQDIQKVIIEHGVTSISNYAFGRFMDTKTYPIRVKQYDNITSITFPDTLTSIGSNAFAGCSSLAEINLPDGLIYIGECAFSSCESLEYIVIPDSATTLGAYLFEGCFGLKNIELPKELISIGDYFFQGCISLESIDLPDTVTSIGKYAFSGCYTVENIVIPAGVTEIVDYTFSNISHNEELFFTVTFLGNAPTFGSKSFNYLTTTVYYPSDDATWTEDIMQDYGGTLSWVPVESGPDHKYGDANGDSYINVKDVVLLRQYLAGWDVDLVVAAADANGDGTVNVKDVVLLRQYLAGWDVALGPDE